MVCLLILMYQFVQVVPGFALALLHGLFSAQNGSDADLAYRVRGKRSHTQATGRRSMSIFYYGVLEGSRFDVG